MVDTLAGAVGARAIRPLFRRGQLFRARHALRTALPVWWTVPVITIAWLGGLVLVRLWMTRRWPATALPSTWAAQSPWVTVPMDAGAFGFFLVLAIAGIWAAVTVLGLIATAFVGASRNRRRKRFAAQSWPASGG